MLLVKTVNFGVFFLFSFLVNLAIRQRKVENNRTKSIHFNRAPKATRPGHHHSPRGLPRKTTPRVDRLKLRETCSCPQDSYRKAFPVICIKMIYLSV